MSEKNVTAKRKITEVEQALSRVDAVVARYQGSRADHDQLRLDILLIRGYIKPTKPEKK